MQVKIIPVLIALLASAGAQAGQRTLSVRWNELPLHVVGKQMKVVLTSGVRLEGRGVSVGADSLVMDVRKSSEPGRPHSVATLYRPELAGIEVRKSGWKWKVISPIICFFGFGFAGAAIGDNIGPRGFIISDGAVKGAAVGMLSGIGVGIVLGSLADRNYVRVEIAP